MPTPEKVFADIAECRELLFQQELKSMEKLHRMKMDYIKAYSIAVWDDFKSRDMPK